MGKKQSIKTVPFSDTAWIGRFLQNPPRRPCLVKGYVNIYCPEHPFVAKSGMIPIQRLVTENKIGRYLYSGEIVHHKNGNKIDNRPKNLEVMTKSEHRKLHMVTPPNLGLRKYKNKIDKIIELRKQGLFAYQISNKLAIPRRTINRYLKQNGLERSVIRPKDKKGQFI